MSPQAIPALIAYAVLAPGLLAATLAAGAALPRPLSERVSGALTGLVLSTTLGALLLTGASLASIPGREAAWVVGSWFGAGHATFTVAFFVDPTSLLFAALGVAIVGVDSAFAHRYLHREPGYRRYFVLLGLFTSGLLLVSLGGTAEMLFAGWELLGLSSALLVAFFHDRPNPTRNALRVFIAYRIGDAALMSAVIVLHHHLGSGPLFELLRGGPVPAAVATPAGLLLLVAAAAKGAQLPFSGWLPRAMEGPTASSAVFYGALSVHAGALVLLRAHTVFSGSLVASACMLVLGLATALWASVVGRAQTDIKSALAFATMSQVGLILAEIALGWTNLATLHIVGNTCLRLLQLLRAPSILQDFHRTRAALGTRLQPPQSVERHLPLALQRWLFRFALERGYVEGLVETWVVGPFLRGARRVDRLERAWVRLIERTLTGGAP